MIPPETISPTHISSLHQATDCHCSTVKVCKDGNEWMALLRSPSWWKQWNQQNISRFVKNKSTQNVEWWSNKVRHVLFHLHFAELNTRHSKTSHSLYIAGTISGIGRYATFALRLQPHYSWRFAKKYNFGQWRKFQNKSTIDHWNHIWTHGSLQPTAKKTGWCTCIII